MLAENWVLNIFIANYKNITTDDVVLMPLLGVSHILLKRNIHFSRKKS